MRINAVWQSLYVNATKIHRKVCIPVLIQILEQQSLIV